MSLLIKAGSGLVAGVIAGGLGLAFFPHVEPTALKPRKAVEKPQFVVSSTPTTEPSVIQASASVAPVATPEAKPPAPAPVATPTPVTVAVASPKTEVVKPEPAKVEAPKATPPSPAVTVAEARAASTPTAPSPAPANTTVNDDAARWSVRGLVALAKGDVSSARLFLVRAAEAGDPRAWVALADTYDPAMLAKLGVVIAPGDAQRAKDYLVKAAAAGVAVKDRMAALDSSAQSVH